MENSQPGFVRKGWKSFINDPNTIFLASGMVNKVKCKCANSSAVFRLCFPALGSLTFPTLRRTMTILVKFQRDLDAKMRFWCHLNRNLRQPYSKQLKNDLSDSCKTSKSDGPLFVFILCALSHLAANMTPRMTSHDQKSSDKKLKVDQDSCLGRKTN